MVPKVVLSDEFKQPDFTGMVDHGAIGVFDNFVKWEFCDSVIDSFEFWHSKKHIKKDDLEIKVTSFNGRDLTLNPMGEGGKQFPKSLPPNKFITFRNTLAKGIYEKVWIKT